MAFFVDALLVLACVLGGLAALLTFRRNKWTRRGIPTSDVHPLLGNIKDAVFGRKTVVEIIKGFYMRHKHKGFVGFFSLTQPMVMVTDLELVKKVLIGDFAAFTDRNFEVGESDPMEFHGMFAMRGQQWRNLRTKLTPTFTSGRMKRMFEHVDTCAQRLVDCLRREKGDSEDVDIKDFCGRYATDVIASVAFGIEGKALENPHSEFRAMLKKAISPGFLQNIVIFLAFAFPWMARKLNLSFTDPQATEYVRKTVWDTVEYREKNNVSRNDFLNLLMQIRRTGNLQDDDSHDNGEAAKHNSEKIDLEGDKFVAQCYLFLSAGFETSSSTMSFALYEMAVNPDVQRRAYEEITAVLKRHNNKVTYDSLQEMTYLHMVTQETLRKYPVLAMLDRRVTRPFRLPGSAIELTPGDAVMVPVIGLHYDPAIYPHPERFDPERFSEEQRALRPSCTFLGFGDGPRNCIGMRMGYLQAKLGLLHILRRFQVNVAPSMKVPLAFKGGLITQVDGGIQLRLTERGL